MFNAVEDVIMNWNRELYAKTRNEWARHCKFCPVLDSVHSWNTTPNPNSGRDIWEFECLTCSFEFSQAMVQRYVMHKENQDELQKG